MQGLPDALTPLAKFNQFILWTTAKRHGKLVKLPVDHRTGAIGDAHDPALWMSAAEAISEAQRWGAPTAQGVGFVFTDNDPFFFVDVDKCLLPSNEWSPLAMNILSWFPGGAVEVSQSGAGLHIFGRYTAPVEHGKKNTALGLELYTSGRFVALTGSSAMGSADVDFSANFPAFVEAYFPPKGASQGVEWTTEARADWTGTDDDDELIKKALSIKNAGSVFGRKATFADLWAADEDMLAASYPDPARADGCPYDRNAVDMALAQHLAFWTGNNCERILKLMKSSGLVRDKWDREDYLIRTIENSVAMQETVYSVPATDDAPPVLKLKGSDKQKAYANNLVTQRLEQCTPEQTEAILGLKGNALDAKFWIDNQSLTSDEIIQLMTPVSHASTPLGSVDGPEITAGFQFLGVDQQIEHFSGCVYVQDAHRVFTPDGALLKKEQFDATYGGYVFQLESDASGKTTRKAWDAFTESQAVRYPKANGTCFLPQETPGALVVNENRTLVNTYIPVETPRLQGDVTPFLAHLAKVLPDVRDQNILLSYMAACIQHKGVKFQWAPLIQGVPGNGKTLFSRCVAFAIGERYTHWPMTGEIAEKYNEWYFDKLFIAVEDIYVPEHKKEVIEVLKPMITGDRLAMRAMQQGQVMRSACANFMLNSNHRNAIIKNKDDRRFAVFFSAQQEVEDLARDGLDGDYFRDLYNWLRGDGYAKVAHFLETFAIPEELNPAGACQRAPDTSTTAEVLEASLGGVEQEIKEAIAVGKLGFAGGWVSSMALERLLQDLRATRAVPPNKRRAVLKSLGYDWHPALNEGRVNNIVSVDGGKPRLFIQNGHISANLTTPAEVVRCYEEAQTKQAGTGNAAQVFGTE